MAAAAVAHARNTIGSLLAVALREVACAVYFGCAADEDDLDDEDDERGANRGTPAAVQRVRARGWMVWLSAAVAGRASIEGWVLCEAPLVTLIQHTMYAVCSVRTGMLQSGGGVGGRGDELQGWAVIARVLPLRRAAAVVMALVASGMRTVEGCGAVADALAGAMGLARGLSNNGTGDGDGAGDGHGDGGDGIDKTARHCALAVLWLSMRAPHLSQGQSERVRSVAAAACFLAEAYRHCNHPFPVACYVGGNVEGGGAICSADALSRHSCIQLNLHSLVCWEMGVGTVTGTGISMGVAVEGGVSAGFAQCCLLCMEGARLVHMRMPSSVPSRMSSSVREGPIQAGTNVGDKGGVEAMAMAVDYALVSRVVAAISSAASMASGGGGGAMPIALVETLLSNVVATTTTAAAAAAASVAASACTGESNMQCQYQWEWESVDLTWAVAASNALESTSSSSMAMAKWVALQLCRCRCFVTL